MNQELIDKHRDINVDGDWWYEGVYDWFMEECKSRGVAISTRQKNNYHTGKVTYEPEISWSGFWSQGDGAAFAGYIQDIGKALGDFYLDYPILQKYVDELNGWYEFSWSLGRGNNIVGNSFNIEGLENYLEDDHPFVDVWQEQLDKELDSIEPMLGDLAQELCNTLYAALRDEYEALTSDEAVWDTIVANELDKEVA